MDQRHLAQFARLGGRQGEPLDQPHLQGQRQHGGLRLLEIGRERLQRGENLARARKLPGAGGHAGPRRPASISGRKSSHSPGWDAGITTATAARGPATGAGHLPAAEAGTVHQYSFHCKIWGCMLCFRATTSMVRRTSMACPDADDPHGVVVEADEALYGRILRHIQIQKRLGVADHRKLDVVRRAVDPVRPRALLHERLRPREPHARQRREDRFVRPLQVHRALAEQREIRVPARQARQRRAVGDAVNLGQVLEGTARHGLAVGAGLGAVGVGGGVRRDVIEQAVHQRLLILEGESADGEILLEQREPAGVLAREQPVEVELAALPGQARLVAVAGVDLPPQGGRPDRGLGVQRDLHARIGQRPGFERAVVAAGEVHLLVDPLREAEDDHAQQEERAQDDHQRHAAAAGRSPGERWADKEDGGHRGGPRYWEGFAKPGGGCGGRMFGGGWGT